MKFSLDKGAYTPMKAHYADAGFDIKTPVSVTIAPHGSAIVHTGVHVQIPEGYVGMIKSKSGINVKRSCVTEGVIDSGYTGEIVVKVYNLGNDVQCFEQGDKITQLVVMPVVLSDVELISTEELINTTTSSTRGNGGFGSTGR